MLYLKIDMTKEKNETKEINIEEMIKAGLYFGHKSSKINPKMMPYIQGIKNNVHIINLEKTAEKLKEVLEVIEKLILEKKTLLFVGTKVQIKNLIKETATECALPYVSERWLGGTFTNFDVIKKRIEYFKNLEKKRNEGEFDKYTKKERAKIDLELKNLESKFSGIKNLEKLPEAIFVADMIKDSLAIKEAKKMGIKVIAIADTNSDPTLADYFIPANDDAVSSVKYILDKIKAVILKAKSQANEKL